RKKVQAKLRRLGQRMEEFDFYGCTCEAGPFDKVVFRRGFIEDAWVEAYVVHLFVEALPQLTVLRHLDLDDDAGNDDADPALRRLVPYLDRLPLETFDCHAPIEELDTVQLLADSPHLQRLSSLALWFDFGETGDEAVALLAGSPHVAGLRALKVEHSLTFTD